MMAFSGSVNGAPCLRFFSKGADMDANQRSEVNNQTNNGANEKWTPGSKGKTQGEGPLDHTYPQGAAQQQGAQHDSVMGTQQTGAGPGASDGRHGLSDGQGQDLRGGSMQTQQTGGSGPQQGITDSHQRQMEQRSGAYGQLEQPVGERPHEQGTTLAGSSQRGNTQATEAMNPQNAAQPELQGGSLGGHHGNRQSTQGGGQAGPQAGLPRNQSGSMGQQTVPAQGTQGGGLPGTGMASGGTQAGSMNQQSASVQGTQGGGRHGQPSSLPPVQRDDAGGQESTDRTGSQTGNYQRELGVHQSNDSMGGLPRSPGNAGPYPKARSTHLTGPDNAADLQRDDIGIHDSNNSSGGLPRSPGGANKLPADEKMDDDTGFSNPRR
jgi:hypothetical protein